MHPLFLSAMFHLGAKGMCETMFFVFAFCACKWGLVLSTKLLAGKVCFYVFMCFENKPVDKALGLMKYTDWLVDHNKVTQ
jgi:hypothetical protein